MNFAEFPIGPFFFSTGGVIFMAGVILSTWMLTRTVHEKGLSLSFLNDRLLLFAVVSFLFGRLGAMGRFWAFFGENAADETLLEQIQLFLKKFMLFWHGGIDTFWTAIGFLVVFFVLALAKKESAWKWLDAFVLPTLLLLIFWSLGAFFSGWDYGRPPLNENFLLGITYDSLGVRYSVPLHPVQLYAFVYFSALFLFGVRAWNKHLEKKDGIFCATMLLFVFLGNAILENFRGDPTMMVYIFNREIRFPQLTSFGMVIIVALFLIFYSHSDEERPSKRRRRALPPLDEEVGE